MKWKISKDTTTLLKENPKAIGRKPYYVSVEHDVFSIKLILEEKQTLEFSFLVSEFDDIDCLVFEPYNDNNEFNEIEVLVTKAKIVDYLKEFFDERRKKANPFFPFQGFEKQAQLLMEIIDTEALKIKREY